MIFYNGRKTPCSFYWNTGLRGDELGHYYFKNQLFYEKNQIELRPARRNIRIDLRLTTPMTPTVGIYNTNN